MLYGPWGDPFLTYLDTHYFVYEKNRFHNFNQVIIKQCF